MGGELSCSNCSFDTSGCCDNDCSEEGEIQMRCSGDSVEQRNCSADFGETSCLEYSEWKLVETCPQGENCYHEDGNAFCESPLTLCSNYDGNETACDECSVNGHVAVKNAEETGITDCGEIQELPIEEDSEVQCEYETICSCEWNSDNESCSFNLERIKINASCGNGSSESSNITLPNEIGVCSYSDNKKGNCTTGDFVKLSWTAEMNWKDNNYTYEQVSEGNAPFNFSDTDEYINDSGVYHWTPIINSNTGERFGESCQGNERIVPCPQRAKLGFFGFFNILIALVLIAFAYYFLIFKKNKSKKKIKKRNKKK